jgi:hypothetical protein
MRRSVRRRGLPSVTRSVARRPTLAGRRPTSLGHNAREEVTEAQTLALLGQGHHPSSRHDLSDASSPAPSSRRCAARPQWPSRVQPRPRTDSELAHPGSGSGGFAPRSRRTGSWRSTAGRRTTHANWPDVSGRSPLRGRPPSPLRPDLHAGEPVTALWAIAPHEIAAKIVGTKPRWQTWSGGCNERSRSPVPLMPGAGTSRWSS